MVTTRRFYRINRWPIMYNIPAEAVKVSPAVHSGVRKPNQTFAHWLNAFLCKTHWILVASVSVSTLSHLDRSHLSFLARWCESGVCVTRGLVNVWDAESPSPWSGVLCCVCFLLETFARRAGARSSTSLAFNVAGRTRDSVNDEWLCVQFLHLESGVCARLRGIRRHLPARHGGELSGARGPVSQRADEHQNHQPVHPQPGHRGSVLHRVLRALPGHYLHSGWVGVRTCSLQSGALHHLPHHVREHLHPDSRVPGQVRDLCSLWELLWPVSRFCSVSTFRLLKQNLKHLKNLTIILYVFFI